MNEKRNLDTTRNELFTSARRLTFTLDKNKAHFKQTLCMNCVFNASGYHFGCGVSKEFKICWIVMFVHQTLCMIICHDNLEAHGREVKAKDSRGHGFDSRPGHV